MGRDVRGAQGLAKGQALTAGRLFVSRPFLVLKLKPEPDQRLWVGMTPRKTIEDIRRELSDLILEAVPEPDPVRRTALLTLADHWSELLRKRRAELERRGEASTPYAGSALVGE